MAHAALGRASDLLIGAAWLLGLSAALLLADGLLHGTPMARALLTALAASVALGRAGVVWDERDPTGSDYARSAKLLLAGLAYGALVGIAVVLIAVAMGWVRVETTRLGLGALFSLAVAAATAVREELLFRALPFHFIKRAGLPETAAVGFATVLSATPILLLPATSAAAVALALGFGWISSRLVARTESVWGAIGSSIAARVILGVTLQTALLAFDWKNGEATLSPAASGAPAWIAAGLALALGFAIRARPSGAPPSPDPRSLRTRRRSPGAR